MKIDITKLSGYRSDMSAEEKLALYEGYDIDLSGMVKKEQLDKAASEAAEWKRKYNATLSESEQKAAAEAERFSDMEKKLAAMQRRETIGKHVAEYVALGFDRALAAETAEAMADGKMDVVFANMAKHQAARDGNLRAEILKSTPTPPAGNGMSGADYRKMAEEAYSRSDYSAAAYYTRLDQQNQQANT